MVKLLYIGIFKNSNKPAHELVCEKDLSSFGFFEKSTVSDFLSFFSKTVAESPDAKPGRRQTVEEGTHAFHCLGHNTGICGIIVSDLDYPPIVAQSLLSKILDEFTMKNPASAWARSDPKIPFPELKTYITKYQNPSEADSIMKIQRELDETKIILHKTIESVLERGEKIDNLVQKSEGLSTASKAFYTQAKKQNSCCLMM